MNLEHLSSKMRLDMNHLLYEQRTQRLNSKEFEERFKYLASGYCSLVGADDLQAVEMMVKNYKNQFHLQ
ncbi:hypothetical protein [Motiliproteus sp. MSK22-1]|uniref:hypothetical protein n=1 Tax=Motiliproteus sp. MSK22-1 TaxID=1897630 RepID=UPI0009766666|nr:hypothetical protein [Motiliproteus sp. MSK22-1]OMH32803.1 hypothetical protein BGP75_14875 [Motiliproteus sp. MSK22-1]